MDELEARGSRWLLDGIAAILGVLLGLALIWIAGCGSVAESRTQQTTSTTEAPPFPTTTCPPPVEPAEPTE